MQQSIIKPPPLVSGGKVAIVSPASPEKAEKFDAAMKRLTSWGYAAFEGSHARSSVHYFAGQDVDRAADFNSFLRDSSVTAIIAARGGYGCSRLLPLIDYETASENPKIILGGSDLTSILWAIHQKTGLVTFFGPMALQIGQGLDDFSLECFQNALKGSLKGRLIPPDGCSPFTIIPGKARGKLIGGCLSLVTSLLGTEYFGDVSGKILFLEEIGEKPFRIDRMLTHLRNAGVFDSIAGVILGDFYNCWTDDDDDSPDLPEMIKEIIGDRKVPVIAGLPFGHAERKMTLPLGIQVEVDADNAELTFLEEGVSVDA